jgi:molybdopterin-guanine dinucleotide biosynthesis protein A
VACDLPTLEARHLRLLPEAGETDQAAVLAVGSSGRPEPLCALYHQRLLSRVDAAILREEYGLRHLLKGRDIQLVDFPDSALTNMNLPDRL